MITSKQRAKLRGIANTTDTILQIGKNGIVDTLEVQVNDALLAREIIKIKVLETCPLTAKEAGIELAEKTNSELVQVIGSRITLYKANPKNPVIKL
jgi:RNA-binding protein